MATLPIARIFFSTSLDASSQAVSMASDSRIGGASASAVGDMS